MYDIGPTLLTKDFQINSDHAGEGAKEWYWSE